MRAMVLLLGAFALSGCGAIREQQAQADDVKCRSYGAQPGTDAYVNCRSQAATARSIENSSGGMCVRSGNMMLC